MMTFPYAPNHVRHPPQGLGELWKSTVFFRGRNSTLWLFSNPPKAQRFWAWRHSPPTVLFSIWDFYFDISEWHILPARAWTPVLMLHLTNPCDKWKVLSLTKPKGKIYKTKSLGHYITTLSQAYSYTPSWSIMSTNTQLNSLANTHIYLPTTTETYTYIYTYIHTLSH